MIKNSAAQIAPAFFQHEPVLLSGNRFPVSHQYEDDGETSNHFTLDVYVEGRNPLFSDNPLVTLESRGFGGMAFFRVDPVLDSNTVLGYVLPVFTTNMPVELDGGISRVGFKLSRAGVDQGTLNTHFFLKGGISDSDFRRYGQNFLSAYCNEKQIFLTFQPIVKPVTRQQPEYVNFLTNFDQSGAITCKARRHFMDGSFDDVTLSQVDSPRDFRIYQFPIGVVHHPALQESGIRLYEVYLVNASGRRLTEVRAYQIRDADHAPVLVFTNGLGGYDILACFGDVAREGKYQHDNAFLIEQPQRSGRDINREGRTEVTLRTGDYPPGWLPYFDVLLKSEDVRLLEADGTLTPLVHATDSLSLRDDTDPTYSAEIKFMTDRQERNASLLR